MRNVIFTQKQKEALRLLKSPAKHILLYGGSRSGKTFSTIEYIVRQCLTYAGLRAFIARHALAHIKASIWQETLQTVLKSYNVYPDKLFMLNHTDLYVKFVNGSELYLAGLDNEERVEKILGREFAIIYLNEVSQIDFQVVNIVKTRLSQCIKGFNNKLIFDCNPPSPLHWTYKMFIEKIDPKTQLPLHNPEDYISLKMNPTDNIENLSSDYIQTLESLPERDKKRFLYGEFVKIEGAIFDKFNIEKTIDLNDLPNIEHFVVGIDNTGNNLAAILFGFSGQNVYALDEIMMFRENHTTFNNEIYRKWAQYTYIAYCDPAAGALNDYIWNAQKTDNAVQPSINLIRELLEFNRFFIVSKNGKINCPVLSQQMTSYHLDQDGRIVKQDDHAVDCARYAIYNKIKYGGSILLK